MEGGKLMTVKKQKTQQVSKLAGILYLGRFQAVYYLPERNQVFTQVFPNDIVRDLEVVKKDSLNNIIKEFVAKNQLDPRYISILIADEIIFSKNFSSLGQKVKEDEIESFVESIPFEEQSVVKIPNESGTLVAVANKDYFLSFKKSFEIIGFKCEYVLPAFLFSKISNLKNGQSPQSFEAVIKHMNEFRQYNLNQDDSVITPVEKVLISNEVPKDKKRLFVLGGVFAVLIIVLIVVYVMSQQSSATPQMTQMPSGQAVITPTDMQKTAASYSAVIQYLPQFASKAADIKSRLEVTGVQSIELAQNANLSASSSGVIFSPVISQTMRQNVLSEISKVDQRFVGREDNTISVGSILIQIIN